MNNYFPYFNPAMRLLISHGCTDDAYLIDMMAKGIAKQKACVAANAAAQEEMKQVIAEIAAKKQILLDDMKASLESVVFAAREAMPAILSAKFKENTSDELDETTKDVLDLIDAYEIGGGSPELIQEARAIFSSISDTNAKRRADEAHCDQKRSKFY